MKKETKLITRARKEAGLTQTDISDALGYRTCQAISNAERGICGIPRKKIRKFCRVTKLEPTEYFLALVSDFKNKLHEDIL